MGSREAAARPIRRSYSAPGNGKLAESSSMSGSKRVGFFVSANRSSSRVARASLSRLAARAREKAILFSIDLRTGKSSFSRLGAANPLADDYLPSGNGIRNGKQIAKRMAGLRRDRAGRGRRGQRGALSSRAARAARCWASTALRRDTIAAARTARRGSSARPTSSIPTTCRWCSVPSSSGTNWNSSPASSSTTRSGLLQIGPPDGEVLRGVRAQCPSSTACAIEELSAAESGGALSRLSRARRRARRSSSSAPATCWSSAASWRMPNRPCGWRRAAHWRNGAAAGTPTASGVIVETDRGTLLRRSADHRRRRLVEPTARAIWAFRFEVLRKPLYWWRTRSDVYQRDRGCPGFPLRAARTAAFTACRKSMPRGVKVAEHTGGAAGRRSAARRSRKSTRPTQERVAGFVGQYLPEATPTARTTPSACTR